MVIVIIVGCVVVIADVLEVVLARTVFFDVHDRCVQQAMIYILCAR